MNYPVAEIFNSIQGEGEYTGQPMTFIRLAGCNVGKYKQNLDEFPALGGGEAFSLLKQSVCTDFSGMEFVCDTDYHALLGKKTEKELAANTLSHVCISGGEPFMHNLSPLIEELVEEAGHEVHIETSGTKPINIEWMPWITCSPKLGFLPENSEVVNEWKFLVGEITNLGKVEKFLKQHGGRVLAPVHIQPVNDLYTIDKVKAKELVGWLCSNQPTWKLSLQLHKLLGVS